MKKILNIDGKDELTISDLGSTIDALTGLRVLTGFYRSVQDWQLEKHMPMFAEDMTVEQKTKAAAIIAKVKARG